MSLRDQPPLGQRTACCNEAVELKQDGISGFQLLKDLPLDCNRAGCLLMANLQPPFLPFLHTAAKRQEQQPTRSHSRSLPVRSIVKPRPSLRTGRGVALAKNVLWRLFVGACRQTPALEAGSTDSTLQALLQALRSTTMFQTKLGRCQVPHGVNTLYV
jgi:hypothetical protein